MVGGGEDSKFVDWPTTAPLLPTLVRLLLLLLLLLPSEEGGGEPWLGCC